MALTAAQLQKGRMLLQDDEVFSSTLLVFFLDIYGMELLDWLPETISQQIQEDFNTPLKSPWLDRLLSAISIVTTDSFYTALPDFIQHCNVLSGSSFNPDLFDPADAAECAWGITEALALSPPDNTSETGPFSEEIRRYVREVVDAEGMLNSPDVLRIAAKAPGQFDIGAFGDDPELGAAVVGFEQSKTEAINAMIESNLEALSRQIDDLPLENRNV